MKLSYRNQKNAEAIAAFWGKPLDKKDWYKINAEADGEDAEIMVYDVVGWPYVEASQLVNDLKTLNGKNITVRINSPGGDVFDGVAIYNAFRNYQGKVTTRVEGLAASIASIIAMSGREVQAYSSAMLMVHNSWSWVAGNAADLRGTADILEKIDGNLVDIYASQTKMGKKHIKELMDGEDHKGTWLTAKDAKEKGFIDTILDGKSAKAQFDLSMFANCPECLQGDSKPHGLTERDIEKAIRDVYGLSHSKAKAILAGCREGYGATVDQVTEIAAQVLKTFGGK